MPSWVKDEDKWAKAKEIAKKQYPDVEEGSDKFYSIVTGIYKQSGCTMAKSLTLFMKSIDTGATYHIEQPQTAVAIARAELIEATDASNNAIQFNQDRTDPHPSAAEIAAGDYQMRKVGWQGLTISIENEAGSTRSGTNRDGQKWSQTMKYAYGFVNQSTGTDGDCVDCFLGPDEDAQFVYIVHARKVNRWDEYDEDKVMLNFPTEEAAAAAFLECYSDPRFLGPITPMPVIEFVQKVQATNGTPTMIKAILFLKANIKGYTRKDGTYVAPHSDNRHASTPAAPAPKKTFSEHLTEMPNAEYDPKIAKRQKRLMERRTGQKHVEVWTVPGKEFRGTKYGNSVSLLVSSALAEHHLKEGNLSKERVEGRHMVTGKQDAPAFEFASPPSHHDAPPAAADPDEPSAEYKRAHEVVSAASREFMEVQRKYREFMEVQRKYRAREIGDAEFLAGKKKHDAAQKVWEAAYAKENQGRGE